MRKKKYIATPTDQEIQDYLDGLNRTNNGVALTSDGVRLEAIAVKNYLRWFEKHGIAIYRDVKAEKWKLGKQEISENDRRRDQDIID